MTSERISLLTILTACMFAFSMYMQKDLFLFPFGIFKTGLFVATVAMLVSEKKKPTVPEWLVLVATGLLAASSQFIFQIVLREQVYLSNQIWYDQLHYLLELAALLLFFSWQIWLALQTDGWKKWIQLAGACCFSGLLLLNTLSFWFSVLNCSMCLKIIAFPALIWAIGLFAAHPKPHFHRALALLVLFIVFSGWISGCFFGGEAVFASF